MLDRKFLVSLFVLIFFVADRANAMCYSVYRDDLLIYQSTSVPVDMSSPMSQTIPAKFGAGATMMFNDGSCTEVSTGIAARTGLAGSTASARKTVASKLPRIQNVTSDEGQMEEAQPAQNRAVMDNLSRKYGSLSSGSEQAGFSSAIQTGPRGGQFYMNSNGNKTYIGSGTSARSGRR